MIRARPARASPVATVAWALAAAIAPAAAGAHEGGAHTPAVARTSAPLEWAALAVVAAAALLYLAGVRRLWRGAGRGQGIRRIEAAAYAAGLASMAVALAPPLDRAAASSFAAHMVQHQLLMLVAPPLLVAGRPHVAALFALGAEPRAAAARAVRGAAVRRIWAALTAPLVATALHGAAIWAWHVPALWEAALAWPALHAVQHATFLASAVLFWWAMIQGRFGRAGYGVAVLWVFVTALHTGGLGALLSTSRRVVYPLNAGGAAPGAALGDQQLGGLLMWIPSGLVLTVLAVALLAAWLGELERRGGSQPQARPPPLRGRTP